MLKAGFAVADITPELGKHIPGGYAPRISTGVLDPLQARACVAAGERETAAVVGVDAVSVRADIVAEARTRIRAACGIPERNVLIAASHTHSGGPSNDVLGVDCDPAYAKQLAAGIAEAVVTAHSRLQPAEVACGSGRCDGLSFNRRFKMRGGGEATNPKKGSPDILDVAGPVDPELGVIAFRGRDGRLLGVIGNFACHCTVVGGEKFSGDYPAYWQQALGLDIPLVFLNGACGDISQRDHRNAQVMEMGVEWAKRMGRALATETRRVLERAEFTENADVATAHGATWVRYRRAEPAVLEEHRRVLASDVPFKAKWLARDVVLLHEQIGDADGMDCPVDVMRVGCAATAAAPWQPFCQFGLDIKKASPFRPTLIAAFANGSVGYVPTRQGFLGGGYEPTLCRGSKLQPDAGERIVAETAALLAGLG